MGRALKLKVADSFSSSVGGFEVRVRCMDFSSKGTKSVPLLAAIFGTPKKQKINTAKEIIDGLEHTFAVHF
jgi:hypothetical protein